MLRDGDRTLLWPEWSGRGRVVRDKAAQGFVSHSQGRELYSKSDGKL